MELLTDKAIRWLRQHGASERSFSRVLRRFFQEQADRVAQAAADVHGLTPNHVSLIFSADAEHAKLLPLIRRNLAGLMVSGAVDELKALERHREARKSIDPFDPEYAEQFGLNASDLVGLFIEAIPQNVRDAIRHAVDESAAMPYWRQIQDGVSGDIAEIIKSSIDEGEGAQALARRIRAELGGDDAKYRAASIARTETTMALNSGHYEALQDIESSDMVLGKEWLAVGDKRTRTTHMQAHGQQVAKGQPFIVGGYECRFPGDWNLPARERTRCRCTCVGVIDAS